MTLMLSADNRGCVSHDSVCTAIQEILRTAQAQGITDELLESRSGVKARAIKSYRVEGKEPSLSAALSIASALGTWAVNRILSVVNMAARPLDGHEPIHAGVIVAEGLAHFTTIATAAADGRIDHIERHACRKAADKIIATVLPLASAGGN